MKFKDFILGKDVTPAWFNDICASGRAKINKNEDDEIISATLHTPTGLKTAMVGDTIISTNSGISMIPKNKAIKYGVQHNVKSEKENNNKKGIQQKMDE